MLMRLNEEQVCRSNRCQEEGESMPIQMFASKGLYNEAEMMVRVVNKVYEQSDLLV